MRTVYTVNTCNKFAALSLSDDEDQQVASKQEVVKAVSSAKENPSALIYPKSEAVSTASPSALETDSRALRTGRKGNTVHRGGRGGYTSAHRRVFDRRDASGKGHRVSKQSEAAEIEDAEPATEKKYSNVQSSSEASNNQLDDNLAGSEDPRAERTDEAKEEEIQMISYEEYMRMMAPKKLEVPKTETVKGNTTAKDFEKEGLQRYVREDGSSSFAGRSSNNKNKPSKNATRGDKGVFNYFELVEKYSSRSSFGKRGGNDKRRNKGQQKPSNNLRVRREAPDVSDTRAFPALGQ